jgi:predicted aspartyl protease
MAKLLLCVALISGLTAEARAEEWNPYAAPANEFEQRLRAAAFGEPGADRALQDWLTIHSGIAAEQRLLGYHQLCTDYDALTWFQLRRAACTQYVRLKEGDPKGTDRAATAFAEQPPVRAIGSAKIPLIWNKFGCQSAVVVVGGVKSAWFVDTGAEIAVVRAGLAKRMGVRILTDNVGMGTTTATVSGQTGIIDRLEIGDAVVENLPVLILPDAQLDVPGVGQIDGILGLQLMVAFGRVAWVDGGVAFALGEAAPKAAAAAPRIYWQEEGVGVPVRTARGIMGAFLDTGANKTDWRMGGTALLDPSQVGSASEHVRHVGGAGGVVELRERRLENIRFHLGREPIRLAAVSLSADKRGAAKVGMDAVSQFDTFILDFETMRMDGHLKAAGKRHAARKAVPAAK